MANELSGADNQPKLQRYTAGASASDRRQWVAQLRAAGVPNKVLARVVLADGEERRQKRLDECQEKFARGEVDADEFGALDQEREQEQEADLRAALGDEGCKSWDQENVLREINLSKVQLTGTETNALYELRKNLQQRIRDLEEARRKGKTDLADFTEEQDKAQAEFDQKSKALLGDERYAITQGVDDGSGELRREVAKLNPSDSQFQDLLKAQRQWTDQQAALVQKIQQDPSQAAVF
jgi:hypothetical protein